MPLTGTTGAGARNQFPRLAANSGVRGDEENGVAEVVQDARCPHISRPPAHDAEDDSKWNERGNRPPLFEVIAGPEQRRCNGPPRSEPRLEPSPEERLLGDNGKRVTDKQLGQDQRETRVVNRSVSGGITCRRTKERERHKENEADTKANHGFA